MGGMALSLLVFFGVLSVLVLVHELGHFLSARRAGIKVIEFGFGLPPRIMGKRFGETLYSVNALPFGGFVKLLGEDEEGEIEESERQRSFLSKSRLTRSVVISAGVIMNFALAVLVFGFVYTRVGIPTKSDEVMVVGVVAGSPAQAAGIAEGDRILDVVVSGTRRLGEKTLTGSEQFLDEVEIADGKEIEMLLSRGGNGGDGSFSLRLTPRSDPPSGEGPLGVVISSVVPKFYPFWQMPFRGAYYGFVEAIGWARMVFMGFGKIVFDLITSGRVPADVSGPVGIYQLTSEVSKTGFLNLFHLIGILSVNLAVLNILPIPALDGGRLLFIGIEAVFGRKVLPKFERWAHSVGLALLLALILLVTFRDIQRLLLAGRVN